MADRGEMDLGAWVLDRGLLDRDGRRVGKVDDLILEFSDSADGHASDRAGPEVVALLSGPMGVGQNLSGPTQRLIRACYRLLGVRDPAPSEIPWRRVASIDVVVHLDVERAGIGWSRAGKMLNKRFISRLPGA